MRAAGAFLALAALVAAPACSSDPARLATGSPRPLELVDVAADVGLDFRHGAFRWGPSPDPVAMTGGGVCWLDHDGDGRLDLFAVNGWSQADRPRWRTAGGLPTTRLYRNLGGRFEDVTDEAGAGHAVRGQGCVAADLDADGRTDLVVTTAERTLLLWNEGGRFVEDPEFRAYGWLTGAAAGDLDGDGLPELFLAGYADLANRVPEATLGFPNTYLGVRDLLFVNEGGRRFREAGVDAGLEAARFEYGLGAVMSDLDRDGDLDLYVANDTNPNRLYENVAWPGGRDADPAGLGFRFEERAAPAGVADANSGMGVAAGDFDGDSLPDLFVTNARGQVHAAFRSGADAWLDARAELGVDEDTTLTGWGVSWADLDLDSDLDLLVANGEVPVRDPGGDARPLQLFENRGGRFAAGELARLGRLLARGSAAADYDDDGDLDVAVVRLGGPLLLLENRVSGPHRLTVVVERAAPGTEVTALLPGGRRLTCEVRAGGSYLSSEDPRCHFGLGAAGRVRELVVRRPGGAETRLGDVDADQVVVVEGA